jgi:hypothetical protein
MAVRAPDNEWNACCGSSFAIPTGQPKCHHIPGEVDEEDDDYSARLHDGRAEV